MDTKAPRCQAASANPQAPGSSLPGVLGSIAALQLAESAGPGQVLRRKGLFNSTTATHGVPKVRLFVRIPCPEQPTIKAVTARVGNPVAECRGCGRSRW